MCPVINTLPTFDCARHQHSKIMVSFIAVSMILSSAIKLNGLLRGLKMTHQTDHAALKHVR